jgi:hypothetical protein
VVVEVTLLFVTAIVFEIADAGTEPEGFVAALDALSFTKASASCRVENFLYFASPNFLTCSTHSSLLTGFKHKLARHIREASLTYQVV